MSYPEVLLWCELRKRPGGFKFRRQLPQDPFSGDFACLSARLGIEVDGEAHDRVDQARRDIKRDVHVEANGLRVLRIRVVEVLQERSGVIAWIVEQCRASGPLHHRAAPGGPPPRAGEDER